MSEIHLKTETKKGDVKEATAPVKEEVKADSAQASPEIYGLNVRAKAQTLLTNLTRAYNQASADDQYKALIEIINSDNYSYVLQALKKKPPVYPANRVLIGIVNMLAQIVATIKKAHAEDTLENRHFTRALTTTLAHRETDKFKLAMDKAYPKEAKLKLVDKGIELQERLTKAQGLMQVLLLEPDMIKTWYFSNPKFAKYKDASVSIATIDGVDALLSFVKEITEIDLSNLPLDILEDYLATLNSVFTQAKRDKAHWLNTKCCTASATISSYFAPEMATIRDILANVVNKIEAEIKIKSAPPETDGNKCCVVQ